MTGGVMDHLHIFLLLFLSFTTQGLALDTGLCSSALGMQSGAIPDDHITASSFFDDIVKAIYARAHVEVGGGAWCPRNMVNREGKEFIEVNLDHVHVVTKVEVQGRFGNGKGQEFTEQYKLHYWRPGLQHWVTYKDGHGNEMLEGNSNTYLAKSATLRPPVIASRVRFVPYSRQPRTVCMRVEVFGCNYTEGVVSYSMPEGNTRGGSDGLHDLIYDGSLEDGWLYGGLGQLIDGEIGHTNFRVDALGLDRGYEWVGWKNDSFQGRPVEIIFEFDDIRIFSSIHIYTNNFFTKDTQVFSHAVISFSIGGEYFTAHPEVYYEYVPDRIFDNARNITIKLENIPAKFIKIELFFALRWIMISDVAFVSVPCGCNLTEEIQPTIAPIPTNASTSSVRVPIVPTQSEPSDPLLVGLVTLGIVFCIIPLVLGVLYYRSRMLNKTKLPKTPPTLSNCSLNDTKKVSMKMKDLHINMNLSPMSNGYSIANGKLYGHVTMDDDATTSMYHEPYKMPLHNPGYYTLNHNAVVGPDTPLKCPLPIDTDDSIDYAVPQINAAPPPSFSEVIKSISPPPVPLTKPPNSRHNSIRSILRQTPTPPIPPMPVIPPPPEQEYYMAPKMCLASNIQGVTGTSIYAFVDCTMQHKEIHVQEITSHCLHPINKLGEGAFGVVQLCKFDNSIKYNRRHVVVKTLNMGVTEEVKEKFLQEVKLLSILDDPNIAKLIGVVTQSEPHAMVLEYMDYGDLYQFLKHHVTEEGSGSPHILANKIINRPPTISYGALVHIAAQIAAGMKHLESVNLVHRDLSARNCLVGFGLDIKISDFGMSRSLYSNEYYKVGESHTLLPIRWMSCESILQGRFSSKSDVWAFGVTLWEIFTMARRRPYDELSNEEVLENISHCHLGDGSGMSMLPQPAICPRDMYDMMTACWRANEKQRPPFWDVQMFLQRKNLGYTLDYVN
ncbi:unnamed protein product [Meganyctiphanes norvegica]|uniref:Discoidin domain-containing receptor 2 n=1 Tax=Meganyctiphanes norvegica TaxID=48144 RepID=A0AAV2RYN4_MEGNR